MPIRGGDVVRTRTVFRQKEGRTVEGSRSPKRGEKKKSPRKKPQEKVRNTGEITIHVCDEGRGKTRDFHCAKDVLVREMKYFKSYVEDLHKVDISVHCDVYIFEWLMTYIQTPQQGGGGSESSSPPLEPRTAVSILVAAEFLGMDRLVHTALDFIRSNLNQVIQLPIDLSCINETLVSRLSARTADEELCLVKDATGKILPRLYRKKVECFLRANASRIGYCKNCGLVFDLECVQVLQCSCAVPQVDFHGRLQCIHSAAKHWDIVKELVEPLRRDFGLSWEEIFWGLWASFCLLTCSTCSEAFCGLEFRSCQRFHQGKQGGHFQALPPRGHFGSFVVLDTSVQFHTVNSEKDQSTLHKQFPVIERFLQALKEGSFHKARKKRMDMQEKIKAAAPGADSNNPLLFTSAWFQAVGVNNQGMVRLTKDQEDKWRVPGSLLEMSSSVNEQSSSWQLEHVRDEDTVNMHSLVENLKQLRS